jgi:hypothetical protein
MAASPAYAATVHNGSALLTTAETNLEVPTQAVSVFVAGASGSKIEEIDAIAVATTLAPATVAGLIYLFLYDGTTYHLRATMPITAVTASATVAPWTATPVVFNNLWLKSGWTLFASISAAPTTGAIKIHAFGADY